MDLEVEIFCPFGKKCQEAVDGKIKQCAWYIKLEGTNPQNGEKVDEYRCAIAWQPIIALESNGMMMRNVAATESFRNETTKRQDLALGIVANAKAIESK